MNKINIPNFGEKVCSNNLKLYDYTFFYEFYKKGTYILHNEYGPAYEHKDGSYSYFVNNKSHRLNNIAIYSFINNDFQYRVIGKHLGNTKEDFIKNLADVLIPNNIAWL